MAYHFINFASDSVECFSLQNSGSYEAGETGPPSLRHRDTNRFFWCYMDKILGSRTFSDVAAFSRFFYSLSKFPVHLLVATALVDRSAIPKPGTNQATVRAPKFSHPIIRHPLAEFVHISFTFKRDLTDVFSLLEGVIFSSGL